MKRNNIVAIAGLLVFSALPVSAQDNRWSVEIRAGGNISTESFAEVDQKAGVGLEGSVAYRVLPNLSLYAGWDWQHRQAKDPLFGATADVEDTGYAYGVRYLFPVDTRAKPFLRLGGLFNHVEIEDEDGTLVADSKHTGQGWEMGGGLNVTLNDSWSLTPGVRYRRFSPDVRFGGTTTSATVAYVTLDVGVAWKF